MDVKVKGLFGASMAIGAGFVIGKYIGQNAVGVIHGVSRGVAGCMAVKGNKTAKEFCDKNNIDYKVDEQQ